MTRLGPATAAVSAAKRFSSSNTEVPVREMPSPSVNGKRKVSKMMRHSSRHAQILIQQAKEERFAKKHAGNDNNNNASGSTMPPTPTRGHQKRWRVGQNIIVTKVGSHTGKKGIVVNPEWKGRVMVRMLVTGATKSYANHEIRTETYTETAASLCVKLVLPIV